MGGIVALPRSRPADDTAQKAAGLNECRVAELYPVAGEYELREVCGTGRNLCHIRVSGKGIQGMWYVIQVRTGAEEEICIKCKDRVSESVMKQCFIPRYEEKNRVNGRWEIIKKTLFPGYVFLDAEDADDLFMELKKVTGMTKLLGIGDDIIPLSEEETAFLMRFGGPDHLVGMSEGLIEGSKVRILDGPLMGMETMIKRIDRHKRKAWVEIQMMGEMREVEVGLEIPMKTV